MYQYASKVKTQSEGLKSSTSTANKNHAKMGIKTPMQLMPQRLSSPLQLRLRPKQENSEAQLLPMMRSEEQARLAPRSTQSNNTGIPLQMKEKFENLSGFSFDDVKVHYNSDKPAQLQALAYTQGNQVYIGPGQEKHLGHELGHVVQQKQGRVMPTKIRSDILLNDDLSLEREADHFSATNMRLNAAFDHKWPVQLRAANLGLSTESVVIQLAPRGIHDTVFYGTGPNRAPYLAHDSSPDHSMPHLNIDTLNEAIGLSNDTLMRKNLGQKRAVIWRALFFSNQPLSREETAWKEWLQFRINHLLMLDLDAKQCRIDIGVVKDTDSSMTKWWRRILPAKPKGRTIEAEEGRQWKEGDYLDNFAQDELTHRGANDLTLNDAECEMHDKCIESVNQDEVDEAYDGLPDTKSINTILDRTHIWLRSVIMYRFWRMTSLMGLDFLKHIGKHVAFVRREKDDGVKAPDGQVPITSSEWKHAQAQGYVDDQYVTEHRPI